MNTYIQIFVFIAGILLGFIIGTFLSLSILRATDNGKIKRITRDAIRRDKKKKKDQKKKDKEWEKQRAKREAEAEKIHNDPEEIARRISEEDREAQSWVSFNANEDEEDESQLASLLRSGEDDSYNYLARHKGG